MRKKLFSLQKKSPVEAKREVVESEFNDGICAAG